MLCWNMYAKTCNTKTFYALTSVTQVNYDTKLEAIRVLNVNSMINR